MRIFWLNAVSNEDLHAKARTEPREEESWQNQDDLEENNRERANGYEAHMASSRRCRRGQNRMADKCGRLMLQTERKLKEEMTG
jgi:hypothetical protein